jgi:hypothetical protein
VIGSVELFEQRGEMEEEYDGLEVTLEKVGAAGVSFRPAGADDAFKEE